MRINTNPPVEASRATRRSIQMWEQEEGFVFWNPVRWSYRHLTYLSEEISLLQMYFYAQIKT